MVIDSYRMDEGISFDTDEFAVEYELSGACTIDLKNACYEFFAPGGTLAQATTAAGTPCEERPQQLQMALAIAEALENGSNACIEAPTGVGKSFAYLIPLMNYALDSRRPVLISTETINLQHQLIEKDLPFLNSLTASGCVVALAKGRSNYLCRRRLAMLSGEQRDQLLPLPQMVLETEKLIDDLANGNDENYLHGIRDNSRIWHLVCSESGNCAGPKCEFYRNCYYFKARRQWDEADVVVANHALFLTDLAIRRESGNGGALLPDYGAVLIDEAHTLENNAAAHLGIHLARTAMLSMVNRFYNPAHAKGLFMRQGAIMLELRGLAQQARDEIYGFFHYYEERLKKENSNSLRLNEKVPDPCPEELIRLLSAMAEKLDRHIEEEENESFRTELAAGADKCRSYADMLAVFSMRQMSDAVYYIESEQESIVCNAAPLNVAQLLSELLFNGDLPVLLCSATLTANDSFDHFISRTGFSGGQTLKLDSPFSPEQAQLLIKRNMPEPTSENYLYSLASSIGELVSENHGNAFVLFTSYQSMNFCRQALQERFAMQGLPLLVQGEGITRSQMLYSFKSTPGSVLFGTDSFWTGVDVPGDNLTLVIITRLPFASPGSPITAARMERIEAEGKSSFFHYSLPEAVLKFRQGAGRLIRTKSDRGKVAVLDSRIVTRRYGKDFINSLPYKTVYIE
ncbi:MAG: DEAD/DEAH box helicase [Lentisphaeria bacterium]|nr:DEAD/DEAH box helicase [Lentisphaeria bacterium]